MPVALNLYKIRDEKGDAGDFFRAVQKQKPNYQGLWVVSPEGKVLSAHQDMTNMADGHGKWAKQALADLEAGLAAFGPVMSRRVEKSESLADRGMGVQSDGCVTLAVTDRWVFVKDLSRDPPRDALGATVLDSITLTAVEFKALAPREVTQGMAWTVPEETARKFFPLLSTGDTVFRDGKEVTSVRLTGRVDAIADGMARLRYEGEIAAIHHGTKNEAREGQQCSSTAKLLGGIGLYDVKTARLFSLTLVYDGLFRNYAPYDNPPARFGAVVEWSQEQVKR